MATRRTSERRAEGTAGPLRRAHRKAHLPAVAAAAVLAGAVLVYGWTVRASRPTPEPAPPVLGVGAPPDGTAAWEAIVDTPAGAARVAFHPDGLPDGPDGSSDGGAGLWVSLPPLLDAAEPGVVLEAEGVSPRVLGSVTTGPPWLPTPDGLPAGGRLVLMDLARNLRLGETAVPGGQPATEAPAAAVQTPQEVGKAR